MIGTFPRLWLCTTATDMRRQFDGLVTLVKQQMALDPLSGQAFIFINRRRTVSDQFSPSLFPGQPH